MLIAAQLPRLCSLPRRARRVRLLWVWWGGRCVGLEVEGVRRAAAANDNRRRRA